MNHPVVGNVLGCKKCDRKILVERALFGIDHTLDTIVVCYDCLDEDHQKKANEAYGPFKERDDT
jgi:hypothetical protein